MVRNLIFDMGKVLIQWDPVLFLNRLSISEEEKALLNKEIFHTVPWSMMDWGMLDEGGFEEMLKSRLPKSLLDAAHALLFEWDKPLLPISGMPELIQDAKAKGFHIYLLSNASIRTRSFFQRYPAASCFEGMVFSAEVKMVKPMPEIFQHILSLYSLKAEESLFIDDLPINVAGAIHMGMQGFLFRNNAEELRAYLGL